MRTLADYVGLGNSMVPTGIQAGAGAGPLAGHGPLPAAAGENNEKIIRFSQ
jgi:hypothetical protein